MRSSRSVGFDRAAGIIEGHADESIVVESPPSLRAARMEGRELRVSNTKRPLVARLLAFAIVIGAAAVFALAARVPPSPEGLGSHTSLGLPACSFPMWTGYPCPTCGMTTAFAHFARGQFPAAFHAQPAGFALAVALTAMLFGACWSLVSGRVSFAGIDRLSPTRVTAVLIGVMVFGWSYKVAVGVLSGALPIKG